MTGAFGAAIGAAIGAPIGAAIDVTPPQRGGRRSNGTNERIDPHTRRISAVPDLARREKLHELTVNSPSFVVRDKFIECIVCRKPSIGLNVLAHVNGEKHQKKLCNYVTPAQHDAPAWPLQQEGLNLAEALAAADAMKKSKEERVDEKRSTGKRSRDDVAGSGACASGTGASGSGTSAGTSTPKPDKVEILNKWTAEEQSAKVQKD